LDFKFNPKPDRWSWSKPVRILYAATQDDPLDLNAGSGSDYQFYHAFLRGGAEVRIVGPFEDKPALVERAYRKAHHLISTRRHAKFSLSFLRTSSRAVNAASRVYKPELIFAKNLAPLVYCRPVAPIVYRMDTTLKGSHDQWPIFSKFEYLRMLEWEKAVLRKTRLAITCSQWSADILRNFYKVPEGHILIVPNPASLPEDVLPKKLENRPKELKPVRLLLVGRDFMRKGVDIAIRTVDLLNSGGIHAELRIVGMPGRDTTHVQYLGWFNKSLESQLREYVAQYEWAHFLLHPARFEAAGIVPGEAAAFGVPTITNASGGLATTVKHNVSGIVLPPSSPAEKYAEVIKSYTLDRQAYLALCLSTRRRFEDELNWIVAGKKLCLALQDVLLKSRAQ
jgi:glycosyltransferase involved in cell wall biosynthesis